MPASITLVPLGTNGFIPSFGRQTMSFLLRVGTERAVLLDAGTGVARLLEPAVRRLLEPVDSLDVVLTHYHLDHVVGLSYLPAVWRRRSLTLWGPERPLVDSSPSEALAQLIGPPLFPLGLEELPLSVSVEPYSGGEIEVAGLTFELRRQRHSGGSVGMVVDRRLAYLTDCEMDEAAVDSALGVDLLLHEMWVSEEESVAGASRRGHSTREEVARFADLAQVRRVAPVHHLPRRDQAEVEAFISPLQALTGAEVLLLREGEEVQL